jgi:hypothetical protein
MLATTATSDLGHFSKLHHYLHDKLKHAIQHPRDYVSSTIIGRRDREEPLLEVIEVGPPKVCRCPCPCTHSHPYAVSVNRFQSSRHLQE